MGKFICAGYSGHAYVVIDALLGNRKQVVGYFDKEEKESNPYGLDYLGDESDTRKLRDYATSGYGIALATGDNALRQKLFEYFEDHGFRMPPIVDQEAFLSRRIKVGDGTFAGRGSKVNAMVRLGRGIILNTGSVVDHDCRVEDFAHVAPGAVLLGNVRVGEGSLIGANAVVKQGVRIGNKVLIGAGSVVLRDVPDGAVWAGNPAKSISEESAKSLT